MRITLIILLLLLKISFVIGQTYSISIDDRNAAIRLTNIAISNINNKEYTKAFNNLNEAIKIDSLYREAYIAIYQVYNLSHEKTDETIQILKKGKRIFLDDDELYFYCGEIYKSNNNEDQAFSEYSKAIKYSKINGEDFYLVPYYYLNRGNLYLAAENYKSAIIDYNYFLKLDSTSSSGLTNRGIAYYWLGNEEKACQDWNMAIKNGYQEAKIYFQEHCKNEP